MSTLTRFFPFLFLISWAKRYKGFIQSHYTKKNSKPAVFFSYPFALEIGPFFSHPSKMFFPVLSKKDRFFLTHQKCFFPSYQKRTVFFSPIKNVFSRLIKKKGICDRHKRQHCCCCCWCAIIVLVSASWIYSRYHTGSQPTTTPLYSLTMNNKHQHVCNASYDIDPWHCYLG